MDPERLQCPAEVAEDPVKAKKAKGNTQAAVPQQTAEEDPGENSVTQSPPSDEPEKDDPATSKAKETLKVYFKETLAFTGFSIGNNAAKPMGSGPVGQLTVNPVCAEKIDSKDVLKLGEDVMREEIRNSLRLARFFSILLQDKTNLEGKDQIPVFIRTVTNDGFPQKHLMGFLPCDVDSDSLFHMLVSEIRGKWGLRMEHCRGFTYLTTGSLCQKLKELSCRMLRDFPQVVLAPSDPYAFNMWLIRSLPVLPIQDVVDTVEEVAAMLRQSETLMKKLHSKITTAYGHIKGEVDRVKEACQNNWEYGTDAFQTMLDILEPLLNSIGEMCTSALSEADTAIVEQLLKLKDKLKNFNFIISLVVLKNTLCCVSILNPSLRGIISISSTLQYTISNALKLLNKHLQEIPIFHRKWFSDAVGRAKKLGVPVTLPVDTATNGDGEAKPQPSAEDYYRETLSKMILQYLIDEVKRVLGIEMVRILRWLSLVPSYMADHNFSIRKDKVADANLNNLARPDSFYDELGCWEVKWRHASKRRILPTSVFATLKIPDIGFYPNVQSLLRVLGSIPCINADADVYGQYDMVLDRYRSYMKEVPAEKRLCNMAFVYVNQDVHFNIEDMVQSYVENHPDILQLLLSENNANDASKEDMEEPREMALDMELETEKPADCTGTDKEALKSALLAAVTGACNSQSRQSQGGQEGEVEYVTKSEMNEVLKVCEDVVREGVLSEVGNSFFSLFIDRAVRLGEGDFLPLFLRFVDSFDVMRLELLGFVDASLDTESMCERLFDVVTKEWRLDLTYCRGQAYLGSGEVSYKLKAFACKVQEMHPLAICTHCSCYSFNTWWSRSVPVAPVCRAIDTLEKIVLFFSSMPELEKELDQVLAVGLRESYEKVHELQGTFCSSWLEKHDSYDVFALILEPLAQCLESFQSHSPQSWSLSIITQAKKLLQLIRDFDFIVALVALKNVSSFTRELSAALQKDHFSAASQLCQISGIVATLNRVKTNIKVFHQNWFDEACAFAQNLGVQIKVPDGVTFPRDSLLKPGGYYKDVVSLPLVDHLINSVKDHFSDDHKEALNFLSLVPCSVTVSYTFESLKSKPPLYIGDLPDPDNFFTELSCWKVKWKTKVVSPTIPDTIFQTLRLPIMQYFANINTLLKIMCVLPSTALEYCGEVKRHKMFQDYLRNTYAKDRSPCLAMLQVGANFNRDLDRMVTQCLKVTPKTLEGICLDKESKSLLRNSEVKEVDNHKDEVEEMDTQQIFPKDKASEIFPEHNDVKAEDNHRGAIEEMDTRPVSEALTTEQQVKPLDENGHSGQPADNLQSSERVFRVAARMVRRNCLFLELPKEEQDCILQELSTCQWSQGNIKCLSDGEILENFVKSIRETILCEVQESPFFSIITDKMVLVDDKKYFPVFVRYVDDCTPKVELLGFLPFDGSVEADVQAKTLSDTLKEEWGLQMACCRGQSFMCMGASSHSLRKMSLDFLASYPLAITTPSESCGLAYWLAVSLHNDPITKVLGVVEDLLLFFDQSPRLHIELSQTMEGLLSTPREALAEVPETCLSRWKKAEDFFDILVDMLEGVLSCLDSVSNNSNGSWSNSMSIHALILSTAIRESDFVIPLVILKNACAPLRNCSTVFRCGNPADIMCELEKIPLIVESLSNMLENINAVHAVWFEEAAQLAAKVAGGLSYPEAVGNYEAPEVGYRETVSIPVLSGLIEEMKFNFSECHLKALKVLSLLPTCNPLPVLPEATDKLYTIYQSDLPEPDTVEDDINTWATAWREKYQDISPPASISETLHHPEAKSHPNVTALLKLVAVLPSISMECDLMKTTLNSLRSFLRNDIVCRGSKTDIVMLLMHHKALQTLEDVIDRCMENDPESHEFLCQMKQNVSTMRMDGEVIAFASEEMAIKTNGSGGSEEAQDTAPSITEDQPETSSQCDSRELSHPAPNTTVTPEDAAIVTDDSTSLERMQELTATVLDGSEGSSAVSPSAEATGLQDVSEATAQDIRAVALDLTPVEQGVTTETVPEVAAQSHTATEVAAQNVSTEPFASANDIREAVQDVPTESYTADEFVTINLTPVVQGLTTEVLKEVEDPNDTTESLTEGTAQDVPTEPVTSAKEAVQGVVTEAVTVSTAEEVTTGLVTTSEVVTVEPAAAQVISTESVWELPSQAVDPVTTALIVTSEPVTAAADVTLDLSATQDITTEPVMEETVQDVTTDPLDAAEVVPMELTEAAQDAAMHPVAELAAQGVTAEFDAVDEDLTLNIAETQGISPDPVVEPAAQNVAVIPVMAVQNETTETVKAAEDVLDLSETTHNISTEAAVATVSKELVTTEQEVTKLVTAAQGNTIEPAVPAESPIAAEVQYVTTEPDTAAEDAPMELTEVAWNAAADPVKELAAHFVTEEPETEAEDAPMDLTEVAEAAATEPVAELVAQDVAAEPVAAVQDDPMDLTEIAEGAAAEPVKEVVAQDAAAVQDDPMDLTEIGEGAATQPVMELVAQDVAAEPIAAVQDDPMDLSEAAQVAASEPIIELAARNITTEPVASALDVTLDPSNTKSSVNTEGTAFASIVSEELVKTVVKDDVLEPITASHGVTTEPHAEASWGVSVASTAEVQDLTQKQVKMQEVSLEQVEEAQCVIKECVAEAPDVTMRPTQAQDVAMELVTLFQGTCTKPTAVIQDVDSAPESERVSIAAKSTSEIQNISAELRADVQDVTTDPTAEALEVPTELAAKVLYTPKEPIGELRADVQNVATKPIAATLDISTEPKADVQNVTSESIAAALDIPAEALDAPIEPVAETRTDVRNVTTEPVAAILDVPTQSAVISDTVALESTAAHQGKIIEPSVPTQCVTVEAVLESQAVSVKPITAAPEITTKPAAAVQGVVMESTTAVQSVNMESVPPEHLNNMESVAEVATEDVTATEDVAMDTTEVVQDVASEPIVTVQGVSSESSVVSQDVTVFPAATSEDVTMEPATTAQDVVMEPGVETREVSAEPTTVAQDVTMDPDADIEGVNKETVTEVQDVSKHATEGRDVSVEPIAAAQDTELKAKSEEVTSQAISSAEDDDGQSKVHDPHDFEASPVGPNDKDRQPVVHTQDSNSQASTTTQFVSSQDVAALPTNIDNSNTAGEGVSNQAKVTVNDGTDQSCPVSPDGPAVVTQAAGQDNLHQPSVAAPDSPVPHKAILSFYDGSAQEAFLKEHANSRYFSITFEQQVEIEGSPYIPVGICYFDRQTLYEDTLAFVPLDEDINVFVDSVTTALSEKCGLNLAFCRGQSLLTVGIAGAQVRAVATLLSQRYPQAVRTINSSVSLNMWLARSSTVTEMAESSMWVEKVLYWLTEDAEKRAKLQNMVVSVFQQDESKHGELRDKLSRSQWERSHDILDLATEILEAIMLCLKDIKENHDNQAEIKQAVDFLCIFQNFEFVLSVVIMKNILSLTKNVSQSLQGGPLDLCQAVNSLPDLLSTLSDVTANVDSHLQTWFQEAVVLASKLKISVDHTVQEPLFVHYREVVSKGAIDHTISEIRELFSDHVLSALHCMQVVPYVISKMEGCCTDTNLFKVYQEDLPDWSSLQVELQKWRQKWLESISAQQPLPTGVLHTLKASDMKSFPNIEVVLRVLAVLPCCRGEGLIRQGKLSLRQFIQQPQRTAPVLYPL
ncbi:hypothetical protein AOLI_G00232080 [Acnodon oligacanthus]